MNQLERGILSLAKQEVTIIGVTKDTVSVYRAEDSTILVLSVNNKDCSRLPMERCKGSTVIGVVRLQFIIEEGYGVLEGVLAIGEEVRIARWDLTDHSVDEITLEIEQCR